MTRTRELGSSRRQLLGAIENQISLRLRSENSWQILLAEPPFKLPSTVSLHFYTGRPLTKNRARHIDRLSSELSLWPEAHVHSNSVPFMGFVLKGEIDWRIGITSAMARKYGGDFKNSEYAVLNLPESTFFVAPPGVPYGTGAIPQWERNIPAPPRTIFWVRFYPLGVQCHISHGDGHGYKTEAVAIFPETRLYYTAESLLEELREYDKDSPQSVQGLLLFIMGRLSRGLRKMRTSDWRPIGPEQKEHGNAIQAVEAACTFVEANFHRKLTLEEIATHALISPAHLCHVFRQEKGQTLTEYITKLRMDYASSLLRHTRLNVNQIAETIGYGSQSYFCQVFIRHYQCTPSQFRKNAIKQKD